MSPSGPRVLVLGANWPLEPFLEQLFVGLAELGHRISVAARRPFDHPRLERLPLARSESALGLLAAAPALAWQVLRRPGASRRTWRGLESRGRARLVDLARLLPALARPFDLFYFPWNGTAVDFLPLFELGVPTLVSCRGAHIHVAPHNPQRAALRAALPHLFARATAVHAVADATAEAARAWGLEAAKATVIRPAVDLRRFPPVERPLRRPDDPLRVLAIGSLIWRKGFEDGLLAIAGARRQGVDARLEVIGEGPDRGRLEFTAADLGLGDAVALRGRQSREEVAAALSDADAFLLPSLAEGIANAALEAMAAAVPVVATRCGGIDELLRDGIDARLVALRDVDAMATALVALARDPQSARALGEAGRRRVEREAPLERQVAAFDRLWRKLAASGTE